MDSINEMGRSINDFCLPINDLQTQCPKLNTKKGAFPQPYVKGRLLSKGSIRPFNLKLLNAVLQVLPAHAKGFCGFGDIKVMM
jgi:hypothetical protein